MRPGRALWSQVGHECSVNLSGSHSALLMLHFLAVRPHPDSDSDTGLAGKGEPGREALSVPAWERIWFFRLIESVLAPSSVALRRRLQLSAISGKIGIPLISHSEFLQLKFDAE